MAKQIPFTQVAIDDAFFSPKINQVCDVTIRACLDKCYETGRISNFAKVAGQAEGEFEGRFYNDSDVYKVLEGVAYVLSYKKNPALKDEIDQIIALIAAAQEADGYIQTYFQLVKPDQKWTDMNMHEDYCIGHLLEAGIAYKHATGDDTLYQVGKRAADLMCERFGPGKENWVAGHQEIELALMKLYHEENDSKYLDLAKFLLEQRGRGLGKGYSWDRADWGAIYNQDHETVVQMKDAKGHSVRALYMYAGLADVAAETNYEPYMQATHALWESVVDRNMYITGGVGSSHHNEGFTEDYDLPNETAYCETCASVAMVYWNSRLSLLFGDSKYADIVEKELYNGILSGISLTGDRFFYDNPLESKGDKERVEWFDCSCCPTQLSRFIPSIGNYIYAADENAVYVNQYISNTACFAVGDGQIKMRLSARYPFEGCIDLEIMQAPECSTDIHLRIPGWCPSFSISSNGEVVKNPRVEKGYLIISKTWHPGDTLQLQLDMPATLQSAHEKVKENQGKLALTKGPVVYCFEEVDNPSMALSFPTDETFAYHYAPDLLGGVGVLLGTQGHPMKAIPYFAWNNRGKGGMKVWIDTAANR